MSRSWSVRITLIAINSARPVRIGCASRHRRSDGAHQLNWKVKLNGGKTAEIPDGRMHDGAAEISAGPVWG